MTAVAKAMGLKAGWSLDQPTQDTDGRAWDFNDVEMKNRAARRVLRDKPVLSIGSPMCIVYSSMNIINHARMDKDVAKARFEHVREHLEFSIELYRLQWQVGLYFLHEHPANASSWQEECIQKLWKEMV